MKKSVRNRRKPLGRGSTLRLGRKAKSIAYLINQKLSTKKREKVENIDSTF